MMEAFPNEEPKRKRPTVSRQGNGFWHKVAALDGREALMRLNGHDLMNNEHFLLVENSNGNANIFRRDETENYSTGCFIDSEGKFGNVADGSSIAAWLRWYNHSWGTIAKALKKEFPELEDKNEQP